MRFFLSCAVGFLVLGTGALSAQPTDVMKQADDMDWVGKYKEERELLTTALAKATIPAEQAELSWRLARTMLNLSDTDLEAKQITTDQALKLFEEGEAYADKAIKLNPANPLGYFWKSSNMGRWGQTKGILDSLFKAGPMHDNLRLALKYAPEFPDAFYVLGELFEKAPGWPLSFGNVEYSVSLGRKAVDLMEAQLAAGKLRGRNYGASIALAEHLWARNWDAKRRAQAQADQRKQFAERKDPVEKQFFYEGTITVKAMADREEAREVLKGVIAELEKTADRTVGYESDLKKARETLGKFK